MEKPPNGSLSARSEAEAEWLNSLRPATRKLQAAINREEEFFEHFRPLCYLVVCPDGQPARCFLVATLDDLIDRLRAINDTKTQVFIFVGERLHVTGSPDRHVVLPDGALLKIDPPAALVPDDTGFLGRAEDLSDSLTAPKTGEKEEPADDVWEIPMEESSGEGAFLPEEPP